MTTFIFDGQDCKSLNGESVLDTLIREGHQVNYSCKKGACKTCLVQHIDGELNAEAQRGLTSRLKQCEYLCACQCEPTSGLKLKSILAQEIFIPAQIQAKQYLSDTVVKLQLNPLEAFDYSPGQYINLRRFDGLTRSYSITNDPCDDLIELHVRRKYNGQFSDWLFNHASVGENIFLQGPWGHCCYSKSYSDDNLTLIACGTGLGPIYAIARDALNQGHKGLINLYHVATNEMELYQHAELLQLMLKYKQFSYLGCVSSSVSDQMSSMSRVRQGDPFDIAKQHYLDLKKPKAHRRHRVFLCGGPEFVTKGHASHLLNEVDTDDIHVLSFEYKELRTAQRR